MTSQEVVLTEYSNTIVQIISHEIPFDWEMPFKRKQPIVSYGSGFFIDNKGHILTCCHCVENASTIYITISYHGKTQFEATIKGICPYFDIALLKVKKYKNKDFCEVSESDDEITQGIETYALGYPLGQDNLKITRGIISGQQFNYYQTDTSINPGNSGGPLIFKNKVIGINGAGILHADNIGYAIPISRFLLIKSKLMTSKKKIIDYPSSFGIFYHRTTTAFEKFANNKCNEGGVMVTNVLKNSPVSKTNLKRGDIVCSINNELIDKDGYFSKRWLNQKMDFNNMLALCELDKKISLHYWRNNKMFKKHFILSDFNIPIRSFNPNFEKIDYTVFGGYVFMNLTLDHISLYFYDKSRFSEFHELQKFTDLLNRTEPKVLLVNVLLGKQTILSKGDIISKINNKKIKNISDLNRALCTPLRNKTHGYYIKIITDKGKTSILSVDDLLSQEPSLSKTYMYKYSPVYHDLCKLKTHKK